MVNEKLNLIVNGRVSDLIIKGGVNISPAEIEPVLLQHSQILEAHVVGVSDERLGEEICAWIRLQDGHDVPAEDVRNFAAQRVSCPDDNGTSAEKHFHCLANPENLEPEKNQKWKHGPFSAEPHQGAQVCCGHR